jgi:transposase
MSPIYRVIVNSKNHKYDLRLHMVRFAIKHGIHAAVREYGCSRNTVRKWLRQFEDDGLEGLKEQSRAPHSCPHKTSKSVERKIIELRKKLPGFGARRLKYEFEVPASEGAIRRIIRQQGLVRKRKRKHQTKRDLREIKKLLAPLHCLQMDVKYLDDIPHYLPFMASLGLPRFQYTIRCVRTGAAFVSYGSELSVTYSEITIRRFLEHLSRHGIDVSKVTVQTDKGSEFDGQAVRKDDRGFTFAIEKLYNAHHRLLLKSNPNANADVESFHSREEPEFFDIECFSSRADFWQKIVTYQHYWNLARLNSYKGFKSPLDILNEADPSISPSVLLLPPVDLDTISANYPLGQHVPAHPVKVIKEQVGKSLKKFLIVRKSNLSKFSGSLLPRSLL